MFKAVLVLSVAMTAFKVASLEEGSLVERLRYLGRGLVGSHRIYSPKH